MKPFRLLFGIVSVGAVALYALAEETSPRAPLLLERSGVYGDSVTFQIALGDLDGDGDLDAVFSNMSGVSEIWLNDGSARFARSPERIGATSHGVAIGDLDNDGDEDLILTYASTSLPTCIYWNDGTGRFTRAEAGFGDDALNANGIHVFDAEGDGDLDVAVYYCSGVRHTRIYLNCGDGTFAAGEREFPGVVAWGDIDSDGNIDAVALLHQTNGGHGFRVFLNDGENVFGEVQQMPASVPFLIGVTCLVDTDGDGDLDLVGGGGPTSPVTVFLNRGNGSFEAVADSGFGSAFGRITPADFDGDGLMDIYLATIGQPQQIGLSNGAGGFVDARVALGSREMTGIGAAGDLDGDGDMDLFVAIYGRGGPNEVWLNVSK